MASQTRSKSPGNGTVTKEQWAARAVHHIQLPSGAWVDVRFPNLPTLIKGGVVPDRLRTIALEKALEVAGEALDSKEPMAEPTPPTDEQRVQAMSDRLEDLLSLAEFLVVHTVVEPKLEAEDVLNGGLPEEDLEMLVAIASRKHSVNDQGEFGIFDARGVRLGVAPLEEFAPFPEKHGCPPGCEACAEAALERSTIRPGRV